MGCRLIEEKITQHEQMGGEWEIYKSGVQCDVMDETKFGGAIALGLAHWRVCPLSMPYLLDRFTVFLWLQA